ncbi:MAG: hypothetical protein HRU19_16570 [Pseudobacteriovorax sp.]|nr:hypothetical protein [Pseudobacteriovorax sp.]
MKHLCTILFLTLTSLATPIFADDDVEVTFNQSFIRESINKEIAKEFESIIDDIRRDFDPNLPDVNVEITEHLLQRKSSTSIGSKLEIKAVAQTSDANDFFNIDADFGFSFGCSGRDLDVKFKLNNLQIFEDISYPVDDI